MASLWTSLCAAGAVDSRYGNVDETRLAHASQEPGQWFTVGRDGDGTYYSPLHLINEGNVAGLGLAWEYKTNTSRGMAATPLAVDGVMYTSGNRGVVYALDATTGKQIWVFDPLNNAAIGRAACCDVVNRGVAVWKGKVYGYAMSSSYTQSDGVFFFGFNLPELLPKNDARFEVFQFLHRALAYSLLGFVALHAVD